MKTFLKSSVFLSIVGLFGALNAHAQNPSFVPGSPDLDATLRTPTFNVLFVSTMKVSMMISDKTLAVYRFAISDDGLFCPLRQMAQKAPYEFFSTVFQNSGCFNLNDFAREYDLTSSFESEKNPIRATLDGIPEIDGKKFFLSAHGSNLTYQEGRVSAVTLDLSTVGTTYAVTLKKWVEGKSKIRVRLVKTALGWQIFRLNSSNQWVRFTHVENVISASDAISTLFSGKGNSSNPKKLSVKKTTFR